MSSTSFIIEDDGFAHIPKDPDAKLNYSLDLSVWLTSAGSASIALCTCTPDAGLTAVGAVSIVGGIVTQIFQGGTAGTSYKAVFHWTTNDGLIDDRTIIIDVQDR